MILYICSLYWKYPQTYLEAFHLRFQPVCNFKIFKGFEPEF